MGHSGLDLLTLSFSHFDPERTESVPRLAAIIDRADRVRTGCGLSF
jgi:hypothetical protein